MARPFQVFDTFREGALPIERASGAYIWDTNGNRYLDAVGGMWCTNIGAGRDEMAEAIAEQVRLCCFANPFIDMTNVPTYRPYKRPVVRRLPH